MYELKAIFQGRFESGILTPEIKNHIYKEISKAGFKVLGDFEYIQSMVKVRYFYFDDKINILLNVPVESNRKVDEFKLFKISSLPIKINEKILKLKIRSDDVYQAIGSKYRTSVDIDSFFRKYDRYVCTPSAEFSDYKYDKGCISNILMNNREIVNKCNFEEIKNPGDTFLKVNGTYFL